MQKIGEDGMRSSGDMLAEDKHKQTDTVIAMLRSPIEGGVINIGTFSLCTFSSQNTFYADVRHILTFN